MILDKLKKLEIESINRGIPIIGFNKGKNLLQKIEQIKPKNVLELGTANGYSGIILTSTCAKLYTIDIDKRMQDEAKLNFDKFNINYEIINGDAVDEIKKFENNFFDIVFIDFAKKKYIDVLDDAIRVTKKKGLIIADNINMEKCQDFVKAIATTNKLNTTVDKLNDLSFSIKL
jgi:predicted O-methyltransferase YrrM